MTEAPRYLSSAEASALAGVAPSTVKRWADEGLLPCVRTAGGHRRFLQVDVERLVSQLREPSRPLAEGDGWLGPLLHPDPHALIGHLYTTRARLGTWHAAADALGGGLRELGEAWASGRILVLEEHAASERVRRALAQVCSSVPVSAAAPQCLLATAAEDDHGLGLCLAELTLREAGWRAMWAGPRSPLNELVDVVQAGAVRMVGLSASEHTRANNKAVRLQAEKLAQVCRLRRIPLVLGGSGWWPEGVEGSHRLHDLGAFHTLVRDVSL